MRLELDLQRNATGLWTGTVRVVGGPTHRFTGVMELVAVLERLLENGHAGGALVTLRSADPAPPSTRGRH
jgi:hypothetical protein